MASRRTPKDWAFLAISAKMDSLPIFPTAVSRTYLSESFLAISAKMDSLPIFPTAKSRTLELELFLARSIRKFSNLGKSKVSLIFSIAALQTS